jgi:hypothetical protein
MAATDGSTIRVAIRVRPLNERELLQQCTNAWRIQEVREPQVAVAQ